MSLLAGNGRNKANLLQLQAREAAQGSPASESIAILPAVPIERMDNDQSRTGQYGRHEGNAGKVLRCLLVERKGYYVVSDWVENLDEYSQPLLSAGSRVEAFKKDGLLIVGTLDYFWLIENEHPTWMIFSDEGSKHSLCDVAKLRFQQ